MSGAAELWLRGRLRMIDPARPVVMGIVNASDSFSDGDSHHNPQQQLDLARQLVADGAELIDVGGESGRTDRPAISADEETRRTVPVIAELASEGVLVSVDTWKPAVAQAALDAGAVMVNDVSGLADPALARACATTGAALVVTHTRAYPKRKIFPRYTDVVADVLAFLAERIELASELGVSREQLVVDPGTDLAKTPADTVTVLQNLSRLATFSRPVLLALSRKDFIGALTQRLPGGRLAGTLAALGELTGQLPAIVRVHDVRATCDLLSVQAALRGEAPVPRELRLAEHLRHEAQVESPPA